MALVMEKWEFHLMVIQFVNYASLFSIIRYQNAQYLALQIGLNIESKISKKKCNKIKRRVIICSQIWHFDILKCWYWLDTQFVDVWWRCNAYFQMIFQSNFKITYFILFRKVWILRIWKNICIILHLKIWKFHFI